jgi:hypothetical protein
MDLGYGIYSSILMNFGREMLEDRFNKAEVINRVYDILFRKRAAIFRLTDPYDFLYLELENMTVLTKQLLEFLKIAGLLEVLGGEKFKKQLEGLRC